VTTASLDGRRFRASGPTTGDVDADTVFLYHQEDDLVWASYEGGEVRRGYLVGTRDADALSFRYVHVTAGGTISSGRCETTIETLPDGRLRLPEAWEWDGAGGAGSTTLEELSPPLSV
jgi:hypothetical protein